MRVLRAAAPAGARSPRRAQAPASIGSGGAGARARCARASSRLGPAWTRSTWSPARRARSSRAVNCQVTVSFPPRRTETSRDATSVLPFAPERRSASRRTRVSAGASTVTRRPAAAQRGARHPARGAQVAQRRAVALPLTAWRAAADAAAGAAGVAGADGGLSPPSPGSATGSSVISVPWPRQSRPGSGLIGQLASDRTRVRPHMPPRVNGRRKSPYQKSPTVRARPPAPADHGRRRSARGRSPGPMISWLPGSDQSMSQDRPPRLNTCGCSLPGAPMTWTFIGSPA